MAAVRLAEPVIKSAADEREYRHITLPNKLQVLLSSDDKTEKSSAALDVNVGHFSDPEEAPGLAHFCEHMLFLGTEKYPDEAEYNAYLNQNGGMSNAYTSMENTNYYFDVKQEFFEGALDRFAQFFIKPLFDQDSTDRELNAIESENSKNLQHDMWRLFQLEKDLSSAEHPFHKFGTGNTESLVTTPKANGIDIRALLLKFHGAYYSANLMRLVVIGREPLDDLEAMVVGRFNAIPNIDAPAPTFGGALPFGPDQLGRLVRVVPVMEMRVLQLSWPLPPQKAFYKTKPTRYFAHLLGHESGGSVLAALKKEGWADGLSAGEGSAGSDFSSFQISIELTEAGLEHVEEVTTVVFKYIGMLKRAGVVQWIWEEEKSVAEMQFRFKEKEEPASASSRYVASMHDYPPAEVFSGGALYLEYNAAVLEAVQKELTVDSLMIQVVSKCQETDAQEKWYETKYKVERISDTLRTKLVAAEAAEDAALHLPAVNVFVPTDFEIRPAPAESASAEGEPKLLIDTEKLKLWHKQDVSPPPASLRTLVWWNIMGVAHWDFTNVWPGRFSSGGVQEAEGDDLHGPGHAVRLPLAAVGCLHPAVHRHGGGCAERVLLRGRACRAALLALEHSQGDAAAGQRVQPQAGRAAEGHRGEDRQLRRVGGPAAVHAAEGPVQAQLGELLQEPTLRSGPPWGG
jgi:insulysin